MRYSKVVVTMPDVSALSPDLLRSNVPWLMSFEAPVRAEVLHAVLIPTLLDTLGISTGSGLPAIAHSYEHYPDYPHDEEWDLETRLMLLMPIGVKLELDASVSSRAVGVVQTVGVLHAMYEVTGDVEPVKDQAKKAQWVVVEGKEYKPPAKLQQLLTDRGEKSGNPDRK